VPVSYWCHIRHFIL